MFGEHMMVCRCNQCGAVVSSMWRLRQHLASHAQAQPGSQEAERREDHVYGRTSRSGDAYNA